MIVALRQTARMWPRARRRFAAFCLVALLHVLVIEAFASGLVQRVQEVVRVPIMASVIAEPEPTPPPLSTPPQVQPAPKKVMPKPAYIPPPEAVLAAPSTDASSRAIEAVTFAPPPKIEVPVAPGPVRTMPSLDLARSVEPAYPVVSRRLREEGTIILKVLVAADGSPKEIELLQGSGYARLDQAALQGVRAGYKFRAGSVDGRAEDMWFTFKFVWELK